MQRNSIDEMLRNSIRELSHDGSPRSMSGMSSISPLRPFFSPRFRPGESDIEELFGDVPPRSMSSMSSNSPLRPFFSPSFRPDESDSEELFRDVPPRFMSGMSSNSPLRPFFSPRPRPDESDIEELFRDVPPRSMSGMSSNSPLRPFFSTQPRPVGGIDAMLSPINPCFPFMGPMGLRPATLVIEIERNCPYERGIQREMPTRNQNVDKFQRHVSDQLRTIAENERQKAERSKREAEERCARADQLRAEEAKERQEAERSKREAEERCARAEREKGDLLESYRRKDQMVHSLESKNQRMSKEMKELHESKRLKTQAKKLQEEEIGKLAAKIQSLKCGSDNIINIDIKFKRIRHLGSGAFGDVNLWENRETGKQVAVKEVPCMEADKAKALLNEGEKLSKLKHENVVRTFGVFMNQSQTKVLLFLELMTTSIGNLARKSAIVEDVARSYTRDIFDGLIYIHNQGFIHRDIKGDNILVDKLGTAKLADLGITKYAMSAYTAVRGSVAGTYAYMSPELFDDMQAGKRSDLWAVGATVYEMIMQHPPFYDVSPMNIMKKTATLRQRDEVNKLRTSQNLKEFLLSIFVEFEKRPRPEEIRQHRWLTTGKV